MHRSVDHFWRNRVHTNAVLGAPVAQTALALGKHVTSSLRSRLGSPKNWTPATCKTPRPRLDELSS